MNKKEFSRAYALAISNQVIKPEEASIAIFDGFGFESFDKVYVTVKQVARLIRWQTVCLDGSIDQDNLQEIGECGRRKFLFLD